MNEHPEEGGLSPDDEDLIEEFLLHFDRRIVPPAPDEVADLVDELVDAVAGPAGAEIAEGLVAAASAVAEQDGEAGEAALAALATTAGQSAGVPREILLAGIDLTAAATALIREDWAAGRAAATRARGRLGPAVLPDGIGLCEHYLAEAAMQAVDPAAARRHYAAAQEAHLAAGRLVPAAVVTGGLAELADRAGDAAEARRLWAQAADLFRDGGEPDEGRPYAERACALAMEELTSQPDHGDTAGPYVTARAARDLAVRHGLAVPAAQFAVHTGIMGADQGLDWAEVAGLFADARDRFRALPDSTPGQPELALALTDFAEGGAAMNRGLAAVAESLLRRAVPVLDRRGRSTEAREARRMLAGLREVFDPNAARADQLIDDVVANGPGDSPQLDTMRAMGLDALAATRALKAGRPEEARRYLSRIDAFLAEESNQLYRGAVHWLESIRGVLAAALDAAGGDRAGAADGLAAVRTAMTERGSGLVAARVAVGRALLLETSDPAGALAELLPAVLALDAVRFTLDGADRRRQWSAVVAAAFAAAYRAADAIGDVRLLAELIEVARANAVPVPVGADAGPSLDALLDGGLTPGLDAVGAAAPALSGAATLGGEETGVGEGSRTVLGRHAQLRTPWGTIALDGPLTAARAYVDPVRSTEVVDWLVTVPEPG